ncbi:MAG: hypothetical protein LBG65_00175 [Puniceicoccales bacterium]|jgi:hypothetical protein|nr:hypothetical protein [Puniceicoccales bacterium]
MKLRHFLLFAAFILTCAGCKPAPGFETRGVPPGATHVISLKQHEEMRKNLETFLGIQWKIRPRDTNDFLKNKFGFSLKELSGFCHASIGENPPNPPLEITIFRGKFDSESVRQSALVRNASKLSVMGSMTHGNGPEETGFWFDEKTFVFLSPKSLVGWGAHKGDPTSNPLDAAIAESIASASEENLSFQFPAEAMRAAGCTKAPFLLFHMDLSGKSAGKESRWRRWGIKEKPEKIIFSAGEKNGETRLVACAEFSQPSGAVQFGNHVKAGIPAILHNLSISRTPFSKTMRKALSTLKQEENQKIVTFSVDLEKDEAAPFLQELLSHGMKLFL